MTIQHPAMVRNLIVISTAAERDGWYPEVWLAIVPGYNHYNFGRGPEIARVIEAYLDEPTSTATQFSP
jgi:hypothetical protein